MLKIYQAEKHDDSLLKAALRDTTVAPRRKYRDVRFNRKETESSFNPLCGTYLSAEKEASVKLAEDARRAKLTKLRARETNPSPLLQAVVNASETGEGAEAWQWHSGAAKTLPRSLSMRKRPLPRSLAHPVVSEASKPTRPPGAETSLQIGTPPPERPRRVLLGRGDQREFDLISNRYIFEDHEARIKREQEQASSQVPFCLLVQNLCVCCFSFRLFFPPDSLRFPLSSKFRP